jgi:hypothetical protein
MPHANHPTRTNPSTLATLGQQMFLDVLRAEMAALQTILPGFCPAPPTMPPEKETTDAGFDNMPV